MPSTSEAPTPPRCSARVAAALLALVAAGCVAGNWWVTAGRTLVPGALETTLVAKERRTEKHPGLDDVVLWRLGDGREVQVTDVVDELAPRGARLEKAAWERTLRVDGEARPLAWSADVVGMARVAGPSLAAALALALVAWRRRADVSG